MELKELLIIVYKAQVLPEKIPAITPYL